MTIKVLLDSGAIEIFIDKKMAKELSFRLQRLEKPMLVRNINRTDNSRGVLTYEAEISIYYRNHIERVKMDVCNLEKTKVILNIVTNFIWTITVGILNWFQQSQWPLKALKKIFQRIPKKSQSDQYSLSYQQISW